MSSHALTTLLKRYSSLFHHRSPSSCISSSLPSQLDDLPLIRSNHRFTDRTLLPGFHDRIGTRSTNDMTTDVFLLLFLLFGFLGRRGSGGIIRGGVGRGGGNE